MFVITSRILVSLIFVAAEALAAISALLPEEYFICSESISGKDNSDMF